MSRLKKIANHVSPKMHEEVNQHITAEPSGIRTKEQQMSDTLLLAKQLIADLPLVPTNDLTYELAQEIEIGQFDDISSIELAHDKWDEWMQRTVEILRGKKILVASRLKKKIAENKPDENNYFIFETIDGEKINENATLTTEKYLGRDEDYFTTPSGKKFHPNYVRFEKISKKETLAFNVDDIDNGDYVDFGPLGNLYICADYGDRFWATDKKIDRANPNASGWYISKRSAKKIIEKYNDNKEDEEF